MGHIPVMLQESLAFFRGKKIRTFFDGTVGAGGFARKFLSEHPETERYYGCDRDEEALALAKSRLSDTSDKVLLVKGNFADVETLLAERGVHKVDGFFLILESHRCS